MAIDGDEMNPARNQDSGSQQTVAPVTRSGPIGTPMLGRDDPAAIGHSPHVWTEVPRNSGGVGITRQRDALTATPER